MECSLPLLYQIDCCVLRCRILWSTKLHRLTVSSWCLNPRMGLMLVSTSLFCNPEILSGLNMVLMTVILGLMLFIFPTFQNPAPWGRLSRSTITQTQWSSTFWSLQPSCLYPVPSSTQGHAIQPMGLHTGPDIWQQRKVPPPQHPMDNFSDL